MRPKAQGPSIRVWSIRVGLCLLSGWPAAPPLATAEGPIADAALVDRLRALWTEQRRDVLSAEVRFRRFRRGGDFVRRSPDQFHDVLRRWDLVQNPDALRPLVEELLGRVPPVDPPWAVREFLLSGQRFRERGPGWDLIVDGSTELVCDERNRFIKLYTPGKGASRWVGCRWTDFRWLPPDVAVFDQLRVQQRQGNQVVLDHESGTELLVSPQTADVLRFTVRDSLGTVVSELHQMGWSEIDGIRVPAVVVQAGYRGGLLSMLTITVLEQARFNQDVDRGMFRRSAKRGDLIRDRRGADPRDYEVRASLSDVLSVVGATESDTTAVPSRWGFRIWLLLNLALVLGLGCCWWIRFRRGRAARP